jgi:uncharacterized protein
VDGEAWRLVAVALAGVGAGTVNGIAGGGTLISFPVLLAVGVPAIGANVTSTVGIWPGYLGSTAGFRNEIKSQRERLRELAPVAVIGAVAGSVLLLETPSSAFSRVAPYLILVSCLLFAAQPFLARRLGEGTARRRTLIARAGTLLACTYGAYFGAGLGVLLLAILGITLPDTLAKLSGLRSVVSLGVNVTAAVIFALAANVEWADAGVLAVGCLVGGYLGARVALRVPRGPLRVLIILIGVGAAARLIAG